MDKIIINEVRFLLLLFFLFFLPIDIQAATLDISSDSTSISSGETLSVDIIVDTEGEDSAGADLVIDYDSSILDFTGDIIWHNIYPQLVDQTYDDDQISLHGVSNPGSYYNGTGSIVTINFDVLKDSATELTFYYLGQGNTVDTNIASGDGLGNDLLREVSSLSISSAGLISSSKLTTQDADISTNDYGKGGLSDNVILPTASPVPSNSYNLPRAGHAESTILIFTAGVLSVLLGFIYQINRL